MTDQHPHDRLADDVATTRAQLFDTLDAIEDKLNVPKQLGIAASKVKRGVLEKRPPYLAGLAAGVVVVGGIVVTVLRRR
ncbi:DUF3618 domain-containing protein [Curtobacterium sp. MCBA15_001]|uniref:DUF3618 domain-containing protein n=1 Tax=Curtobacterium sp. MCBA15_001 TaxID=1898731 RepID=UPI0008DDE2D0|nr:DUF3618 domain-containing protein [Curtobacterium sp. MCBA15_001]OIH92320.1 hypothetical protein BIU90_10395 [Curtobacterium sp. MCBA15_001]